MRRAVVLVFMLWASASLANNRDWRDAKVVNITSENGGAAVAPIGTMIVGVPITKVFYWIQTEDTTYVLGPAITKRQSLNVTLYGKTKIALDGRNAHILDDSGKDVKLPISEKIARPTVSPNQSRPESNAPASGAYQVDSDAHSFIPFGVIFVTSKPSGADIYVDDSFIARAPVTLNLKPGQHYVRAFLSDYQNWSQQITVAADSEGHLAISLEQLK
jgi:PEGA domain-containing protein